MDAALRSLLSSFASVDLLYLDAERVEYAGWWPQPARVPRPGGLLAIDNVLSHPDEVAEFLALADAAFVPKPSRSARASTWRGAVRNRLADARTGSVAVER